MNKKSRVLLSALLSVAVITSSLPVTAAAEGFDASWSTNELAYDWDDDSYSDAGSYSDSSEDVVPAVEEIVETPEETVEEQPVASETASVSTEDIRLMNVVEERKNASATQIAALKKDITDGKATGTCTDGLTWKIDSSLTLTISGTGAMTDLSFPWQTYAPVVTNIVIADGVTSVNKGAFLGFVAVTSVTIGKNVTTIDNNAFYGCVKVASLKINSTALTTIGEGAFYDCTPLASLSIPETVSVIGANAFAGCKKITSVTIPGSVTTIGKGAFYGCESLKDVKILSGVQIIDERAFAACIALQSLTLPEGITSINKEAFNGCVALSTVNGNSASLDLPESVTTIGESAFSSCNSLKGVTITGNIANIAKYAFKSCIGLTDVNITGKADPAVIADEAFAATSMLTGLTLVNVKSIGTRAFYQSGLTKVTLSEGLDTIGQYAFAETPLAKIEIPASVTLVNNYAFNKCTNLTSFSIASEDAAVKFGNCAFADCTKLSDVNLDGVGIFGTEMFKNCTSITSVTLPASATDSGIKVFSGCTNLKTATAPEGVQVIGSQMFFGCPITEFTIPSTALLCHGMFLEHKDIQTVVSNTPRIGERAFEKCTALTKITLNNTVEIGGDESKSKRYGNAFACCAGLTEIILPDTLEIIHPGAFQDCFGLTTITIPEGVDELQSGLFENCKNLKTVDVKSDVIYVIGNETFKDCVSLTEIPVSESLVALGYGAFSGCTGITKISIPVGITKILNSTFEGCLALETVTLKGAVKEIGNKAFYNCGKMKGFTIPSTVTTIGSEAFYACTYLDSQIPSGVTTLGTKAFMNCTNLGANTEIVLPAGLKTISSNLFQNCTSLNDMEISENITTINGYAFAGCSSADFTRMTIPKTVTSIGGSAFEGCTKLQNVTILSNDDITKKVSIGAKAFYNCTSLSSITLPSTLSSIGGNAFENCSKLGSVLIAADLKTLGASAFKNCSSLESAALSATGLTTLSGDVFNGCTSLSTVELPDTVTSIGANAFYNCKNLVNISIPGGVTTLGNKAFANCTSLEMIVIPVPTKSFGTDTFSGCTSLTAAIILSMNNITTNPFSNCEGLTIYCYEGSYAEAFATKYEIPCEYLAGSNGSYLAILKQPETLTDVSLGETVTLNVRAASDGAIEYAWFYKNPGATKATKADVTGGTYSFKLTEANNGVSVYCQITATSDDDTETTAQTDEIYVVSLKTPVISSSSVSGSSVTINWNKTAGATSYRVYRADSLDGNKTLLKAVGTTTYTDETVVGGKTYYYFVASYNSNVKILGNYSAGVKAAVPAPLAKTDVTVVSGGGNATISWTPVSGATSYRVYRSTSLTGTRTLEKVRTSTYYIDTNVDTGTKYYYWVVAYNATTGAKSGYSSTRTVTIVDAFAKTIAIKSVNVLSTSVTLKWDMVPGATTYRIYRRNDDNTRSLIKAQSMTEFKDTGLTKGKAYKYEIRAYSATTKALTDYSAIKQARPMAAPTIQSGNVRGKITWDKNAVATSYRVYRADSLTGAKKLLDPTKLLTYTDTTAVNGKRYYYFVAAYDNTTGTLSAYSQPKVIDIKK